MNFKNLFKTQAKLDEHIMQEHPELRGQNNLDWKLLALQVELAECANEWRGFKKWSKNQKPRTWDRIHCPSCEKKGYYRGNPPVDEVRGRHGLGNHWYYCPDCAGYLVVDKNPLLEEYVDCMHFILTIGLEIGVKEELDWDDITTDESDITHQFLEITARILEVDHRENTESWKELFEEFYLLGKMLGFTWDEVEAAYFKKNKINHERQESGY